jgi:hypothetical protein
MMFETTSPVRPHASPLARLVLSLLALALCALAQSSITVAQLKQFIHSSVERKNPDKQVVKFLQGFKLSERLTDHDLMEMLAEGPGPETQEMLKEMQEKTRSLAAPAEAKPAAPPLPPRPAPSSVEQERIISEAREIALDYTKHLPNFICLQFTRRYVDPSGTGYFHQADTVAANLSYFNEHEDYKVISVGGKLAETSYGALGGAISSGEFGTMLREIFDPETRAEFWFDHWGKLRGATALVFGYRVRKDESKWTIDFEHGHDVYRPGYSGLMFIDRDVPTVLRVTLVAEGIPPSFPIQEASTQLDYDYAEISGQRFLLPSRVEMKMRQSRVIVKNEVEFRNYHKYSGESTIHFEADDQVIEEERAKDKATQSAPAAPAKQPEKQ